MLSRGRGEGSASAAATAGEAVSVRPLFGGAASPERESALHGPTAAGGAPDDGGGPRFSRALRASAALAAVVAVGAVLAAGWSVLPQAYAWLSSPDAVHAFVDDHAVLSRLALLAINTLQIVVAVLPGEPIELASGYAFGFWEGTALCLLASAIGSSLVYGAVRRWGWKVVGLFCKREQIERFGWMRNARRLELIMLVVFLIPGTPKDVLTYVAGLTSVRFVPMLAIATLGRIPSIVTSTIAAAAFGTGEYGVMAVSVAVAAVLVLAGAWVYRRFESRCNNE